MLSIKIVVIVTKEKKSTVAAVKDNSDSGIRCFQTAYDSVSSWMV